VRLELLLSVRPAEARKQWEMDKADYELKVAAEAKAKREAEQRNHSNG